MIQTGVGRGVLVPGMVLVRGVFCLLLSAWLMAASAAAQAPVFMPEDVLAVQTFAGGQPVSVSADGRWVAYVLTDLADEWNIQEPRPTGHVVVRALANGQAAGAPRALTSGATHSAFPVWSPDGRRLAFVREGAGGGRLVVWEPSRDVQTPIGEPFTARAYLAPQWDPSGARLVAAWPEAEPVEAPPRIRVVRNTDARIPGDQFFTDRRRARLVSVDVATGASTPIVPEALVLRSFRLSPTGRGLSYVAPDPETLGVIGKEQQDTFVATLDGTRWSAPRRLPERGRFSWAPDGTRLLFTKGGRLMTVSADPAQAVAPWRDTVGLAVGEPTWAPDGSRFAALVADPSVTDPELEPVPPGMYTTAQPFNDLYIVEADGGATNVTAAFPDQVADPVWSADGAVLFFRAIDNRTYDQTLYRYERATRALTPVMRGKEAYGRLTPVGQGVIASIEDATRPDDLWAIDAGGKRTRITDLNPQLAKYTFSRPELFEFWSADGDRLAGLLYRPSGVRADAKVPVITWVYEKMTPDIHRFSARDQMLLSHGFALMKPNVRVRVGRTADSFLSAVVPAVHAVRNMGFTNGRFGLWGHSFGGYATSTLITRTDIFAAAISSATPPELFRNWASGRDRDSRNIETGQARMGGSPFEYPERYLSQSAFFHLDKVKTPVLIFHGEKDLTILFGEGEMMFYALRQLGKTAELVAYANGDHSLSRHSRADALDVNRRVLAWFDRYLKP